MANGKDSVTATRAVPVQSAIGAVSNAVTR